MKTEDSERVIVRMLTATDYEAMVELWKCAGLPFKSKGRESKKMIEKQMSDFPEFFIGAFHEHDLVGVVIGSYDGRKKGWINRLAVHPAFRQHGIAQRLIRHVEEVLEKHGAEIFCALIEIPNEESTKLFQKMRYVAHREILYVSKRKSQEV